MTQVQESTIHVTSADHTRAIGKALASTLRAGDVIMLNGPLGAGKTTLTQGIGQGLNVRGHVTSPTFTVSRIHPPLDEGGLALVHADAYRITDLDDLETVDLDSTTQDTVTVIEWGEGKTEQLSDDRLEIVIERAEGTAAGGDDEGTDAHLGRQTDAHCGCQADEAHIHAGRQADEADVHADSQTHHDVIDLEDIDSGERTLTFILHGTRWAGVLDDLDEKARALAGLDAPTTDLHDEVGSHRD